MATIEKAVEIAAKSHAGTKDRSGVPYLLHPLRVMMGVEGEAAQIVAVLHDVVEDTPVTLDEIRAEGFRDEIVEALALVTHGADQSYSEYVIALKSNPIARQVKLSDLRDNSTLDRVMLRPHNIDWDTARIQRYVLSYQYLTDIITEDEYRELMKERE